jgi:hypothetical protein
MELLLGLFSATQEATDPHQLTDLLASLLVSACDGLSSRMLASQAACQNDEAALTEGSDAGGKEAATTTAMSAGTSREDSGASIGVVAVLMAAQNTRIAAAGRATWCLSLRLLR